MTIIGTKQEIDSLKHKCDGRCIDGEWCIFSEYAQDGVCPVDSNGQCLSFETTSIQGFKVSSLNEN